MKGGVWEGSVDGCNELEGWSKGGVSVEGCNEGWSKGGGSVKGVMRGGVREEEVLRV